MSRFNIHPRKLFIRTRFNYEKLPGADSQSSSPLFNAPSFKSWKHRNPWANRLQRPRLSFSRVITLFVAALLLTTMLAGGLWKVKKHPERKDDRKLYHWEHYPR